MKIPSIPPHFLNENKKEVVFHIKGGFPVTKAIPTWMESFPAEYKGVVVRCEETFYRLREGAGGSAKKWFATFFLSFLLIKEESRQVIFMRNLLEMISPIQIGKRWTIPMHCSYLLPPLDWWFSFSQWMLWSQEFLLRIETEDDWCLHTWAVQER